MAEDRPKPIESATDTRVKLSRRGMLGAAAMMASGAAIVLAGTVPAEAKMPKKASQYQDTPKGKQSCSNCQHFEPPSSCGIVAGKISPHGWCRFYLKK